jgi:hypothetical protein
LPTPALGTLSFKHTDKFLETLAVPYHPRNVSQNPTRIEKQKYSQSLITVQELPLSQEVAPVHPFPPHRPHLEMTPAEFVVDFAGVTETVDTALLVAAGVLVKVVDATVVAKLDTEADGAALATLTLGPGPASLPPEAAEPSFPTPALVFRAVASSAEVAFHTESAFPIASTAAVSVNEPKSPEPDRELISQARPRTAEQEAASAVVGTLNRPLVSLRVAAETGALQSLKTLPSRRILAPASTSKL